MAFTHVSDPIDVAVGARIRLRRRWLGLSQTELARGLGITFQQVQKYERGSNRVSASTLVRVAKTLETTAGALLGEDGTADVPAAQYQELAVPGATELLSAFARIRDGDARRAIVTVAQVVAGAQVGVHVRVDVPADTPESVASKMAGAATMVRAAQRHGLLAR